MGARRDTQAGGNAFLRGADIDLDAPFGAPPPPLFVREAFLRAVQQNSGANKKRAARMGFLSPPVTETK
jgi:hypothetical protein